MSTVAGMSWQLRALSDAWEASPWGDRIDWTRLRATLDYLALHPEHIPAAIKEAPAPSGSALLDNLLAGIAETLAAEHKTERPAWTSRVPPLPSPWVSPGTPRSQSVARETTPAALAARGIVLSRTSLWRQRQRS